ncbi:succinate dehydrogenase iron-sulfur subunit [Candidatus Pantoea carbekii]|uniref:Succinate dehydrogenase iron-sulfur subunit n=1 Tax=Candidatus Pantoea carbekii TaxID=1235990 RepID=U3U9T4_9GAMM|nr:succinate dehydrogenase iron-sulfur subunit [Candidatus Pantoea carbekii]AKC32192.1 succinate dehydrogenase ironsulfur protein SdhB [Candidatus Pantoea carbekii]BAO00723.1 SdhB protein [Candidatus Pantoea carbekii]
MELQLSIYRYNPSFDDKPYMQDFILKVDDDGKMMLLEVLIRLKEKDPTLTFRRSCREGVCGSDGLNINGKNGLACITPICSIKNSQRKIVVRPLPGLPVIRDLVVDMEKFYIQYQKIKPFLLNNSENVPVREYIQNLDERKQLDGLYECVLCACCSTACPSFWWNPDKFIGPAGLLTAYRFLIDSRDTETQTRLANLKDAFSVFRCHSIMNCVNVCPKGLNPAQAIGKIKSLLVRQEVC